MFIFQVLPGFFYSPSNNDDDDIEEVVNTIYETYISNTSRCVGTEVRAEPVNCLCQTPESSGAIYGYPCDTSTKVFDTSQCIFSRCKVYKIICIINTCLYIDFNSHSIMKHQLECAF
jgi:hypothetical protein